MTDSLSSLPEPQMPRSRPGSGRPFASLRSVTALMMREMSTTYGRNPGGYLWAIAEPIGAIAMLSIAFSFMFDRPAIGNSFAMFYATGVIPFMLYTTASNRVAQALNFSRPLLAYPAVTFVDAILGRAILAVMTEVLAGILIFAGIIWLDDARVMADVGVIALSFSLSALLGVAVGVFNCYLFSRFVVAQAVWSILTRPLFIISGVMFTFESMPQQLREVLWYNPLVHCIGAMRAGFYPTYRWDYVSPLFVVVVSLILLVAGLRLLAWYHRDLLQR